MDTRQATARFLITALLSGLSACSTQTGDIYTPTAVPPIATSTPTATPSPTPVPTATPLTCLTQPGVLQQESLPFEGNLIQNFLVYTPPCYADMILLRYPVLYLLHGQTYSQDQWVRFGIPGMADELIHSGQSAPFMIVFPDDRYWNAEPGTGFGNRLLFDIIPYVDQTYRTLPDRENRALGGLSRGGGWAVELGFGHPELFGTLGLHSPAVFKDNAPHAEANLIRISEEERPRLWMDVGDADRELQSVLAFEEMLTRNNYPHEYHFYTGEHSEEYWGRHAGEYLRWYTQFWPAVP